MSSPLDEACAILDDLEKEIADVKAIWEQVREDNPHFKQVSSENWQEKYHRMWLHGATDVWECNELERRLYEDLPVTKIAQSPALGIYKAWRKWLQIAGVPKFTTGYVYDTQTSLWKEIESKESSGAYYASDDRFDIEKPFRGETLFDFIVRLARLVEATGKGHRLEYRALKSFVSFIRKTYPIEQVAFIEHVFPRKMDIHFNPSCYLKAEKRH